MRRDYDMRGFSLVEVMVAMVIAGVALMGALGAVQLSSRYAQAGLAEDHALAMAQARLEAKRSVKWDALLEDDLDYDGIPDQTMTDDGQGSDTTAGDGIYSAGWEHGRVTLVWTLRPDRPGPLNAAAFVTITAVASYEGPRGVHVVRMGTIRANPMYVGVR